MQNLYYKLTTWKNTRHIEIKDMSVMGCLKKLGISSAKKNQMFFTPSNCIFLSQGEVRQHETWKQPDLHCDQRRRGVSEKHANVTRVFREPKMAKWRVSARCLVGIISGILAGIPLTQTTNLGWPTSGDQPVVRSLLSSQGVSRSPYSTFKQLHHGNLKVGPKKDVFFRQRDFFYKSYS